MARRNEKEAAAKNRLSKGTYGAIVESVPEGALRKRTVRRAT